jgi:spore germination cell wall hydrolase CwlJ-like protein
MRPVPYVMRNTAPVKVAVVKKPRKLTDSECVSSAIYHEARGEPLEGQRAVYEVILHRATGPAQEPVRGRDSTEAVQLVR